MRVSNLAGIVLDYIDPNTVRLYTIDRRTNYLFVYDWDAESKDLTLLPPDPNDPDNPNFGEDVPYYLLDPNDVSCTQAYGLALDNTNNKLYVSYYNDTVHCFDTRTEYFDHMGSVNMVKETMDIDVDETNSYLYGSGYSTHPYIIRYDLTEDYDPNTNPEYISVIEGGGDNNPGAIGLACYGRFLYTTTYAPHPNGQNYELQAWDTNLPMVGGWAKIDYEPAGGLSSSGGAGVCVADVDYVPPFSISKIADVNDVVGCITPRPGEEITYTISYAYNWTEEGDPNLSDFTQIYIEA